MWSLWINLIESHLYNEKSLLNAYNMRMVYANKSHNKLNAFLIFSLHVGFATILFSSSLNM